MKKQISQLSLLLSLALLTSCGPQGPSVHVIDPPTTSDSASIVGGEVVDKEIFAKHVVALYNNKSSVLCTGTLVARNVVLTAAHCANIDTALDYYIFFSKSPRYDKNPEVRRVVDLRIYDYAPKGFYNRKDLALVQFIGDLPPGYEPMALPTEQDLRDMGRKFYVAGYGSVTARKDVEERHSGTLRYTEINLYEGRLSPGLDQFTSDQSDGHGICHGDSGGPAFIKLNGRRILIGVTSAVYTNDKAKAERPSFDICKENSIFVSTYYHLPWIRATLDQLR